MIDNAFANVLISTSTTGTFLKQCTHNSKKAKYI